MDLDALLLDEQGLSKLIPAAELAKIPQSELRAWAKRRARYGIPSLELVALLRELIDGRPALEICAGFGDIGRHIPIRMTDSAMQLTLVMQVYYGLLGQPTITPPPDVERLDANTAVERYSPRVVISSWGTQREIPGDEENNIGSSFFGVDEMAILDRVELYIHIGNAGIHGDKRALKRPHRVLRPSFGLFSRASQPELDCIYIWGT